MSLEITRVDARTKWENPRETRPMMSLRARATQNQATMSKLRLSITMSLDGYVAGPGQNEESPLGSGGLDLAIDAPSVTHIRYEVG